jgi:hypothetical protein
MFWSVDDRLHNVDQLLKDSDEHLHEAIKRGVSQEDLALLRDAVLHAYVSFAHEILTFVSHPRQTICG